MVSNGDFSWDLTNNSGDFIGGYPIISWDSGNFKEKLNGDNGIYPHGSHKGS